MNNTSRETITLSELTAKTVRDFCDLRVADAQRKYVASNAESIAQAYFHPEAWFRGIYADEKPVGFVMLEDWTQVPDSDPNAPVVLWRFAIGEAFQGKGYGRRALELIVEHVRTRTKLGYMLTSWVPGPHSPAEFYLKFGFVPTGEDDDGEIIARLKL